MLETRHQQQQEDEEEEQHKHVTDIPTEKQIDEKQVEKQKSMKTRLTQMNDLNPHDAEVLSTETAMRKKLQGINVINSISKSFDEMA